jgi:hypothetical protein
VIQIGYTDHVGENWDDGAKGVKVSVVKVKTFFCFVADALDTLA